MPDLHLHNPRLWLALASVLQFAHVITGFRSRELRRYLQNRFGLSPDDYTATQLRYDLLKLRAKGFIRKLKGTALYIITPKGMTQGTLLSKLNDCLNATIGETLSAHAKRASIKTATDKHYRRVRKALQQLLETLGISA